METFSLLRSSWLLSSSLVFAGIYILGYCIIFARRWPRGAPERYKAASCCMSIVHGPSTSLAATLYMIRLFYMERQHPSAYPHDRNSWLNSHLGASNTPFEEAIMEFSIAYFLIDLLHYVLFVPNQPLFIIHHIFTTSYMLSCRFYTRHGGFSTIVLFAVAECTSWLQNLWTIASLTKSTALFNKLNIPFLTMFTIFRGIVTPWATWQLCQYYLFSLQALAVVPNWLALYWMCSVFMGIVGSLYWVAAHWAKLIAKSDSSPQPNKRKDL
ncbi:hypothetical protein L7F22_029639 [Adiantum nelumboides]|nr:hypothetical protein [Adiantum nelumboides]